MTIKDGDSAAGPATPAGPPIALDRAGQIRITEGERVTKAMLASADLVEVTLFRSIWGPEAKANINGIGVAVKADGKPHRVPQPYADLFNTAQNARLEADAKARANQGRG